MVSSARRGVAPRKRAFARHSATSAVASESATIPLPMPQVSTGSPRVTVRIGTLKVAVPPGRMTPNAPQYQPRGPSSRSAITAIAASFGAPVTEPHGKSAANTSASPAPGRGRPVTVEVSCHTVGSRCSSNSRSTVTVPGSQTRPRSLRSRSTIIRFSARSLALANSASAGSSAPRVPFIGWVTSSPSLWWKNSSGETLATPAPPQYTAYPPGWAAASAAK